MSLVLSLSFYGCCTVLAENDSGMYNGGFAKVIITKTLLCTLSFKSLLRAFMVEGYIGIV